MQKSVKIATFFIFPFFFSRKTQLSAYKSLYLQHKYGKNGYECRGFALQI